MELLGSSVLFAIGIVVGVIATTAYRQIRRHQRNHPRHPVPKMSLVEFDKFCHQGAEAELRSKTIIFLPNANSELPAATSEHEACLLASLAKNAHRMFEFGTCSGRTTYLWALNSPADAEITTLTLPIDADGVELSSEMEKSDIDHAMSESTFDEFVYSGTSVEHKVRQLFQDSATLDTTPYSGRMDLIFIDGGHSYSYAKNDSLKALEMVAPGGLIVWHDYRGKRPQETVGVYGYLNELVKTYSLYAIEGTSLVVFRKPLSAECSSREAAGRDAAVGVPSRRVA